MAIAASFSWAESLRRLEMCPSGNNWKLLQRYAHEVWGIPTDHFDPNVGRRGRRPKIPLEDILVEGSTYKRGHLKQRLFDEDLKQRKCELCGQDEVWQGRRMSLIIDHVNGVADDHRLANLRIVCPNCNATLDTHCGKKNRRIREPRICLHCLEVFKPRSDEQRYCSGDCGSRWDRGMPRPERRLVERPAEDKLRQELAESSYSAVGRKYGVSDSAIRKWVRAYEAERQMMRVAD